MRLIGLVLARRLTPAPLADAVAYSDGGGVKNPRLSSDLEPLGLTAQEQVELVEFMKALTGEIDREASGPPILPR
jgi:hypothetical protein